jgi:hypothetical protein
LIVKQLAIRGRLRADCGRISEGSGPATTNLPVAARTSEFLPTYMSKFRHFIERVFRVLPRNAGRLAA